MYFDIKTPSNKKQNLLLVFALNAKRILSIVASAKILGMLLSVNWTVSCFFFNQTASSTEKVSDLLFVMFSLSNKMEFNFIHIKNIFYIKGKTLGNMLHRLKSTHIYKIQIHVLRNIFQIFSRISTFVK